MDLERLKAHEDRVKNVLDTWPKIEQLIAVNYLRIIVGLPSDLVSREIEKEYRKELNPDLYAK